MKNLDNRGLLLDLEMGNLYLENDVKPWYKDNIGVCREASNCQFRGSVDYDELKILYHKQSNDADDLEYL